MQGHQEKASDGTDTIISGHTVQKGIGISTSTLNSLFQTPICMLQGIGREHTATQHNTRAYVVQFHRTVVGLPMLLWSYRSLAFKTPLLAKPNYCNHYHNTSAALCPHYPSLRVCTYWLLSTMMKLHWQRTTFLHGEAHFC